LGSGHTVTALYEIIPVGVKSPFLKDVDPLKYQHNKKKKASSFNHEIVTIKFRYKAPDGNESKLIVHSVNNVSGRFENASDNSRFAASVAGFAMLLRNSEFKENAKYSTVLQMADASLGKDEEGYRKEFISLVKKAVELKNNVVKSEDE
jgi:Ca-activated chloride channel family protein